MARIVSGFLPYGRRPLRTGHAYYNSRVRHKDPHVEAPTPPGKRGSRAQLFLPTQEKTPPRSRLYLIGIYVRMGVACAILLIMSSLQGYSKTI